MAPWRAVVHMAIHRCIPKRHHVLLIVWVKEGPLHVWLQSERKTDCVWAISSLQNVAVNLCECLLSTENGWRWEVESQNFVLIRVQGNWVGEGIIRLLSLKALWMRKDAKVLFYPMLPDFRKSSAFNKVPTFRPFAFLKRATSRWRWVSSTVGITGKPKYSLKNLSQCHLVHQQSHLNYPQTIPDPPRSKAGD
jgi:hypothetical protein